MTYNNTLKKVFVYLLTSIEANPFWQILFSKTHMLKAYCME
ncbi:protein of unknown function (plasmid) [Pseudolactococcus piscium]|nr:protein of unknown function [Lactococcus piscium]